jgi:hypothetical protein
MDQDVGNGRLHGGCSAVYLVAFDIRAAARARRSVGNSHFLGNRRRLPPLRVDEGESGMLNNG